MSKTLIDKCTPINYQILKQGPTGPHGPTGLRGFGDTGPRGLQGVTGPVGSIGHTGPRGISITGPRGLQGVTGPVGAIGCMGPVGPKGDKGDQGLRGVTGPVGPLGPIGPRGVAGPAGPQGVAGPIGPRGLVGPPGAPGARGAQGERGPAGRDGHIALQIKKIDETYVEQNIVQPNGLIVVYVEYKPVYEDINEGAIVFIPSIQTEFGAYYQIIDLEIVDRCNIQITLQNIDDHESDLVEKEYMYFSGPRGPGSVINGVAIDQVVTQLQSTVDTSSTTITTVQSSVQQLIKPFHSLILVDDVWINPYTGTNLQLINFTALEFNEFIKINATETILNEEEISEIIIKETGIYMIYGRIKTLYQTNDYGNRILVITKNGVEFQRYVKGTMDGKYSEVNLFSVSDFFQDDIIRVLITHTTTDRPMLVKEGSNVSVTKIY
jgi:hypothetical protein